MELRSVIKDPPVEKEVLYVQYSDTDGTKMHSLGMYESGKWYYAADMDDDIRDVDLFMHGWVEATWPTHWCQLPKEV